MISRYKGYDRLIISFRVFVSTSIFMNVKVLIRKTFYEHYRKTTFIERVVSHIISFRSSRDAAWKKLRPSSFVTKQCLLYSAERSCRCCKLQALFLESLFFWHLVLQSITCVNTSLGICNRAIHIPGQDRRNQHPCHWHNRLSYLPDVLHRDRSINRHGLYLWILPILILPDLVFIAHK